MDNVEIKKLKTLILNSRSFNENEKKQLLEELPNLSENEIAEAITILEDEQKKWIELDQQNQKDLAHFQKFSQKSKKEMEKMAQDIIHKTEAKEAEKESAEAEESLKNI